MDDVTNERFRRIEERLTALEKNVLGMEERLSAKVDAFARNFGAALDVAMQGLRAHAEGLAAQASEERRALHAEQMRKFQEVTEGGDRDRRFADLEARIAKLEALLAGVPRQ